MFDNRLIKLREEMKKTKKEVADALGMPYNTYSNYESNLREPNSAVLIKIADFYNVSTDYLLGLSNIKSVDTDVQTACKVTGLSEENVRLLSKFDMHKDIINYFLGASTEEQDAKDLTIMSSNNNIFYNMIYEIYEYCKCLVNARKYLTLRQKTDDEINKGLSPINMKTIDRLQDISLTELKLQEYGLSISTPDEKLIGIEGVLQKYLSKMLNEIGKKYIANVSKERGLNADNNPQKE